MKTRVVLPAALFLCLAVLAATAQQAPPAPLWLEDYKQALTTARAADRPVFLVFRCVP